MDGFEIISVSLGLLIKTILLKCKAIMSYYCKQRILSVGQLISNRSLVVRREKVLL